MTARRTARLLSLPEAAARLNQTWAQAYAMALSGRLEAVREGARWFVTERSVERLAGRTKPVPPPAPTAA